MQHIPRFFAALSDATRLRLLYLMKEGEICVCFLQGVIQTNQPKISRHLAYLKNAGLVVPRREGKWIYYSLKPQQTPELQKLLLQTLNHLRDEPQIKKDAKRLKEICCCPARYGVSSPGKETA